MHSGQIVKAAMNATGITQVELARRIGRDQTLISRYVNGQIEISVEAARSIAEVLRMNVNKFQEQLQRDKLARRIERLNEGFKETLIDEEIISTGREGVSVQRIRTIGDTPVEDIPEIAAIPLLDSIDELNKLENPKVHILSSDMLVDAGNSFALRVKGQELVDDKIDEGDIVVIDTVSLSRDGDRVLVILNGELSLKRIYRKGNTVVLLSPKGHMGPITFVSQTDTLEIIGRLVVCTKVL